MAGADDYLLKPVIGEELVVRVRNRLERFNLHRFLAERDALTSVLNRHSSAQGFDRLLAMTRRFGGPLAIATLDLDRFKEVNDRYGHAAGDVVLRKLGELLTQAFRGEDVVGRWGGEEFVVAMYGMGREDAVRRLQGLLATLSREEFHAGDGRRFRVSFSAGVAVHPGDGDDVNALHRAADAALYRAKASGRARVVAVGDLEADANTHPDVVVVEDDDALGDLLVASLESHGYRPLRLTDGVKAAEALTGSDPQLHPGVVLLDIELPRLDGVSVLRRLRAEGTLRDLRAIMLTTKSAEEDLIETLELGAFDHVAKPFSVPVLMHKVAQAMDAAPSDR
jgi:diguanylate cyclase (GGDEF)-like protein